MHQEHREVRFDSVRFFDLWSSFMTLPAGGSEFRGVHSMTSRTQQDRGQMSSAFELGLTYVEISSSFHGNPLVGNFEGFSRRGSP
jgi:hypothetical protein